MPTRDRMFCSLCYRDAQQSHIAETQAGLAHPPTREAWVRIADPAGFTAGVSPVNPRTRAAYISKLRAAFRHHVAAVHPVLPFTIGWTRTPSRG